MVRHRLAIFCAAVTGLTSFATGSEELVEYEIVDETNIPRSLTGNPGDPDRGRQVVIHRQQGNCLACHEIPALGGEAFHGNFGPNLAGVAERYTEGELRLRIVDPKLANPETTMPAFYKTQGFQRVMPKFEGKPILTAQQVEDVVAFLVTLEDQDEAFTTERIPAPEQPVTVEPQEGNPLPKLISGHEFATEATQQLQADDFSNPGLLWIDLGVELWEEVEGEAGNSCGDCHGGAAETMKGVGATYPKYHEGSGRPINLEQRINLCRVEHMKAEAWPWESEPLLAMTAYVKHQSRGMPVDVDVSGPAAPFFEAGKALYYRRRGVMNLACKHCHNDNYGRHLRANLLSQGQSNGFPMYRLGRQTFGSLHQFVGDICYKRVRAAPLDPGSEDLINIELYLAWRGSGLPIETPAVRY